MTIHGKVKHVFSGGIAPAFRLLLAAGLIGSTLPAAPARASAPAIFNYQGKLSDAGGKPVTDTAPGVPMAFRIYDDLGALLSTYTPASPVPVTNGVFNVLIGDLGSGSLAPLGLGLDAALSGPGDRFLEVVVNGTALAPRQMLAAVPYALSAADLSVGNAQLGMGAVTDAKVTDLSWTKITNVPAGFADGTDNGELTVRNDGSFAVLSSTVDFLTPLTATTSGGWAHVGVSASSVTLMGNAFNGANQLMYLGAGGAVPVSMGGTGATSTATARMGMEAAWSGVKVSTAAGLSGGGALTGNVTVGLDAANMSSGCGTSVTGKVYWDGSKLSCGTDDAGLGGNVTGTGTTNVLAKWTSTTGALGDSKISDSGSLVTVGTGMTVAGAVAAASFSGDGSSLTNVDAASLGGLGPSSYAPAAHTHDAGDIVSGTLAVARGGTGLASPLAAGTYVRGTGATSFDLRAYVQARGDIGAAASGANADITGLTGLTTPLSVVQGGTGANNAGAARTNLGAAKSGVNGDITSLSGLTTALPVTEGGTGGTDAPSARAGLGLGALAVLSAVDDSNWSGAPLLVANGGTGAANAAAARANLGLAKGGANGDITGLTGLATPLSAAQGGTGLGGYTAGNYVNVLNATALQQRTTSQVLLDIGAAAKGVNGDITGLSGLTTPLSVTQGGTGGNDPASARSGLGLKALALRNDVNNGDWSGQALAVANGGTGAATAANARTNIGLGIAAACNGATAKLSWNGTQLICETDAGSSGVVDGSGTGGEFPRWAGPAVSTTTLTDAILSQVGATANVAGGLSVSGTVSGTWSGATIDLQHGGTGAVNQAGAQSNLGLKALATRNNVNNGDWSGAVLAVANGGTGADGVANIALARSNLGLKALATRNNVNNGDWSGAALAVANGGTGADGVANIALARSNLGLKALATRNNVNNGDWSGTALAVGNGGTGGTTAASARSSLVIASSGTNSDITNLTGLTTPLSVSRGGTGATTPAGARSNLGAAASGANSDITSLTGLTTPLTVQQGGTNATTAPGARASLGAAMSGANADITSLTGLTTPLTIAQGGTNAVTQSTARTSLGLTEPGLGTKNSVVTADIQDDAVTPAKILQGSASQILTSSGAPAAVQWSTMGGDATFSSPSLTIVPGAVTGAKIAAGTVTDANIAAAAAIAYSKLNLTGAIVDADIKTGTLIPAGKLAGVVTSVTGNNGLSTSVTGSTTTLSVNAPTTTHLAWDNSLKVFASGPAGTVTSVTAGAGLSASPANPITSGAGTLSVNPAYNNTWSAMQTFNGNMSAIGFDVFNSANWYFYGSGNSLILDNDSVNIWTLDSAGLMTIPNGAVVESELDAPKGVFGPNAGTSPEPIEVNGGGAGVALKSRNTGARWVTWVRGNQLALWNDTYGDVFVLDENGQFWTWDVNNLWYWGPKTFVINHPVDPSKYLVHATLEGPEAGVYYRGTARLVDGRAEVSLPGYFEALTRPEDRAVLLTPLDGFDPLLIKKVDGQQIKDGKFLVLSSNPKSTQEFDWEVKAVRKDVAPLAVEPAKSDVEVAGDGPYTYIKRWKNQERKKGKS